MVIGVQQGLERIKRELRKRGYQVVNIEKYNKPVDAFIYEGNPFQVSYTTRKDNPEMRADIRSNDRVFFINSLGKSVDEIEDMLNTRYSSPLS